MKKIILASCLYLALGACGGGGSSPDSPTTETGIFIDAPVKGLAYTASPSGKTGITNQEGEFKYVKDDTVAFLMGSISLGTATPDEERKVKVMSLYNGGQVAQLLQTLNHNSDEDTINIGGIEFPDDLREKIIARLANDDNDDIISTEELTRIQNKNLGRSFLHNTVKSKEDVISHVRAQNGESGLTFTADQLAGTFWVSRSLLTPHKSKHSGLIIQFLPDTDSARWIEVRKGKTADAETSWQITGKGDLKFEFKDNNSCTLSKFAENDYSTGISYSCSSNDKRKGVMSFVKLQSFAMGDLNTKSFTLTNLDEETQNLAFNNGTYNCKTDMNSCIYKDATYKNAVWLASNENESTPEGRFLLLARGDLAKGMLVAIQYDKDSNFDRVEVIKVADNSMAQKLKSSQAYTSFTSDMLSDNTFYHVHIDNNDGSTTDSVARTIVFESTKGRSQSGIHGSITAEDTTFDYRIDSNGYLIMSDVVIDGNGDKGSAIGLIGQTDGHFKLCWRSSVRKVVRGCFHAEYLYKTKQAAEGALGSVVVY